MLQLNIYEEFAHWLDDILENNEMPEETKAFCFNLYEESDEEHICGVQLIAAGEYDPEDKDGEWACEEVWSSEENIFTSIPPTRTIPAGNTLRTSSAKW